MVGLIVEGRRLIAAFYIAWFPGIFSEQCNNSPFLFYLAILIQMVWIIPEKLKKRVG